MGPGRPTEARRSPRAMPGRRLHLDVLFAGMPRASVWPGRPRRAPALAHDAVPDGAHRPEGPLSRTRRGDLADRHKGQRPAGPKRSRPVAAIVAADAAAGEPTPPRAA